MEKGGGQFVDPSGSFVDLCTLHQHAMRYYRLWIYACNIVLALATLIFTLFALSILVDPRISLLSGVELYQPTFLYAYIALILQCGVLQVIGCVGALRLNQKLLNTYWTLLLVLMIGDIFVGLVWAFRLDSIKSDLRPNLKQRLKSQYGHDKKFTETWDWVQTNDMCCGVDGPLDFLRFNDSSSSHFDSNGLPLDTSSGFHHPKLPSTCCVFSISHHIPETPLPTSSPPPLKPQHTSLQQQIRSNRVNYPHHYPNVHNFTNINNVNVNNHHLSSFGTGTHNRRKILHSTRKHDNRGPDPSQNPHPHRFNVQTTTETSNRRATQFGVCGLPPELVAKYKHNIYVKVSDTIIDSYTFFEGSGSGSGSGGYSSEEIGGLSSSSHSGSTELPESSSSTSSVLETTWTHTSGGGTTTPTASLSLSSSSPTQKYPPGSPPPQPYVLVSMTLNNDPCGEKVLEWVDHASDILFVIGFCIIVFLKGCFVAILRYEIKEMIQKIKLLNGEDDGRQAAMNELIGLTSMYEGGNEEDPGEREGLMACSSSDHGVITETSANTNIDAIESDKRKDSVISREQHNCHVGNHVGNHNRNKAPSGGGNHVVVAVGGSSSTPTPNPTSTTTTAVVVGGSGGGRDGENGDRECGLLRKPSNSGKKFRNENGGRNPPPPPRNGNNNTTGIGGVTSSASAPIPIESMTKA